MHTSLRRQGVKVRLGGWRQGLYARHQRQSGSGDPRQTSRRQGHGQRHGQWRRPGSQFRQGHEIGFSRLWLEPRAELFRSSRFSGFLLWRAPAVSSLPAFFQRVSKFILSLQTIVLDCAFLAHNFSLRRMTSLGKDMVPKRIFFTKGVGKHRERLTSFELALRDAGIAAQNLVRVSSIFPPNCKLVPRRQGLKYLSPGEVVFASLAA